MASRLLIADDHEVVRQGIRTILRARPLWEISGEAVNGKDAVEQVKRFKPDVVIMDITMPEMSGIEAAREINRLKLDTAVLIFTMHESRHLTETVRDAGARGVVLKSRAARDLIDALETLMGGGTFFGPAQETPAPQKEKPSGSSLFRVRLA